MAYETGTAADIEVFVDKLVAFAQLQGWVVDRHYDNLSGTNTYFLHSGSAYIQLIGQQEDQWIRAYGGTGFDSALNSGKGGLLEKGGYDGCNYCTAPIAEYHMFATSQYVHVAFLKGNGTWGNFVFGVLTKTCNFVGGTYISGTSMCTYALRRALAYSKYNGTLFDGHRSATYSSDGYTQVNAVREGVHTWFHTTPDDTGDRRLACGHSSGGVSNEDDFSLDSNRYSVQNALAQRNINTFNGLTILHPFLVGVHWASNYFTWVGHPQDIKFVSIKHLNPKDIITIGADRWMVFPVSSKHKVTDIAYSQDDAYAYLLPPL